MSSSTIAVGWVVAPRCQGISTTLSTSVQKESLLRQRQNKIDLPRQRFFQNVGRSRKNCDAVIVLSAAKQSKPFFRPIVCVFNHSKLRRVRSNLRSHRLDGSAMFAIQQIVRGRTKIFLKEFCKDQRICTRFPRFCQRPGAVYSQENLPKDDLISSDSSKVYAGNKATEPSSKPFPVIETYSTGRIYVHSNPISPFIGDDYSSQNASRHSFSSLPEYCSSDLPDSDTPVETPLEKEAWDLLRQSVVNYCGSPLGTVAANDPTDPCPLNYDQVFLRDFIPSAIAFLLKGDSEIVRNFILHTLQLQSWEKTVDCYSPGQGLMPASFKVRIVPLEGGDTNATEEILDPDFGESAIGRVAPVDSGLWWIILLRAYGKCTGDFAVQERVDVQTGMKLILKLCLADGFDMFPTLLVTDASCMIDRRMGIHGHPLEIQALFYAALRCAREMMKPEDGAQDIIRAINSRLSALSFHIREYYWIDLKKLNEIYRYKTEEYSYDAVNKFNIYPDQISSWLVEWMPDQGGYFIGNLQPAHMDFRFFSLGNLWAIAGSLATPEQAEAILDLIEARWDDFVGNMPFKICFPALQYEEWRIITGSDPKNTSWSYHNGGSWPTLVWQFTVACLKMRRPDLATRCLEVLEKRISKDRWPEYYDTRTARFVGKQARLYQTWSVAGYLVAKTLLQNPEAAGILTFEEDVDLLAACCCSTEASPSRKRCRKILI